VGVVCDSVGGSVADVQMCGCVLGVDSDICVCVGWLTNVVGCVGGDEIEIDVGICECVCEFAVCACVGVLAHVVV
jgi:hypothetical protein